MLSNRTKTYVAFTDVHLFICIYFSGSVIVGTGEWPAALRTFKRIGPDVYNTDVR